MEEEQSLERVLSLPCPSCGSKLQYSAEKKRILCLYCGHQEDINNASDNVQEQSLQIAIEQVGRYVPEQIGRKVFQCQSCGSKTSVEPGQVAFKCGFCGSKKVNEEAFEHRFIQPQGIIPFYISRQESIDRFQEWIGKGFFTPSKLKRHANIENLHGIYLPFWTYDAQTESDWQGEAGYHYYETERVYQNGEWKEVTVQKTRWVWKSGHLSFFFDDVLIVASHGYPNGQVQKIYPYRLNEVINFDPRLILGWEAEVYDIEVNEGYSIADRVMDGRIHGMCRAQLGGDTYRNLTVNTDKSAQTFKHILLPVWICSYEFNGKSFHFAVNGQTGKIDGTKPVAWIKVILLVLLALAIGGLIYYLNETGVI